MVSRYGWVLAKQGVFGLHIEHGHDGRGIALDEEPISIFDPSPCDLSSTHSSRDTFPLSWLFNSLVAQVTACAFLHLIDSCASSRHFCCLSALINYSSLYTRMGSELSRFTQRQTHEALEVSKTRQPCWMKFLESSSGRMSETNNN
jgi:hypothetical protein